MDDTIEAMRRDYTARGFDVGEAAEDPVAQFKRWFDESRAYSPGEWFEANAMTLATADASGRVTARIVLLKGFDNGCPRFFTNYDSDKGRQMAENPHAALCFYWAHQERQVRIEGAVETVPAEVSDDYFHRRPRGSQLGAIVSAQSIRVPSRDYLESRLSELEATYRDAVVPRPQHWGGYRLIPRRFEFWQGRQNRLHDRIAYRRGDGEQWVRERLAP